MTFKSLIFAGLLVGSPAFSQDINCNSIKNNPASKKRCEDAKAEAKHWQREADRQKLNEQKIKEALRDTGNLAKECIKGKGKCIKEAFKPKPVE